jgi:putative ABC transport system permease protein
MTVLGIARDTFRTRLSGAVGSFVSLALGIGVLASLAILLASALSPPPAAPARYAGAAAVVMARTAESVSTDGGPAVLRPREATAVPAAVVDAVGASGAVVADRVFFAQVAGASVTTPVGRPWPAAAFGGHRLTEGRAPQGDREIVVTGPAALGGTRVLTAAGSAAYTVVGVVDPVAYETPVFFTAAESARLSPRVQALLVPAGDEARVRQIVGDRAEVLTGDRRVLGDPDRGDRLTPLLGVISMSSTAIALILGVVIFVVASTFAFAVAQRRRENGLLRCLGMTPRQLRTMVMAEASLLSAAATVVGALFAAVVAPLLAAGMRAGGLAPQWFSLTAWVLPLIVTVLVVVGAAQLAVFAAARRAGMTSPVAALRTAALDERTVGYARVILGVTALVVSAVMVMLVRGVSPWVALTPLLYTPIVVIAVVGMALLTPNLVRPLARLITRPFAGGRGAVAMVIRENVLTGVGRVAATAAPMVLAIGLSGSILGVAQSIGAAATVNMRNTVHADLVVTPGDAPVLGRDTVDKLAAVPGVQVMTSTPTVVYAQAADADPDEDLTEYEVTAADPALVPQFLSPPLSAGTLHGFTDDAIAVDESWGIAVGNTVQLWVPDGKALKLRVVAVLRSGTLPTEGVISSRNAGIALPTEAYVSTTAAAGTVSAALGGTDALVQTRDDWTGGGNSGSSSVLVGSLALLALIGTYCGISIVTGQVMASGDRRAMVATLRLTGASRRSTRRVVLGETSVAIVIAVLLGAVVVAVNLTGLRAALAPVVPGSPISLPGIPVAVVTALFIALTLAASWVPARSAVHVGGRSSNSRS